MNKQISIVALIVMLTIVPFLVTSGASFSGSDGEAEDQISLLAPNYKPWATPLFEPASGEIESLLFTLQGVLGSSVIFYFLGYYRGKNSANDRD